MCKCLAGNVACCCFNCALNILVSIISTFLILIIIAGVIIYFVYYHDGDHSKDVQSGLDKFKSSLSDAYDEASKKLKN